LESDKEYLLFDFWAERFLGRVRDKFAVPALNFGESQILCVKKVLDHPQFLASTRHISMDAVSVISERWDKGELTVEFEGIPGTKETYWFHAPAGYRFSEIFTEGLTASPKANGELIEVAVEFTSEVGALQLRF
jgi:hypothetical protein